VFVARTTAGINVTTAGINARSVSAAILMKAQLKIGRSIEPRMSRNRPPWDTIRIAGWGFMAGLSFSIAKLFLPGEEGSLLNASAGAILAYFAEATIAGTVLFGAVSALRNMIVR
jgi:hypothetical protein